MSSSFLDAYHHLNHPDRIKEFYFILIIGTKKPLWILTRYRYNQNLIKGLTNPGLCGHEQIVIKGNRLANMGEA